MFVQLTKDFLGRKAGERIDVGEADAGSLIQSGTAVALSDDPLAVLHAAHIDPMRRPETLTLTEFAAVSNALSRGKTTDSETTDSQTSVV